VRAGVAVSAVYAATLVMACAPLSGCTKDLAPPPTTTNSTTTTTTTTTSSSASTTTSTNPTSNTAATASAGAGGGGGATAAPSSGGAATTSTQTTAASPASALPATTRVLIGGQDQGMSGPVTCSIAGGKVSTIEIGTPPKTVTVVLTENPLGVKSVLLSDINGTTLRYPASLGAANPPGAATQTGKSFTIIGTANTQPPSTATAFEIDATC
jgi:hypothetical protein